MYSDCETYGLNISSRQETLATVTRQHNHLHVPFASSRVLSNSLSVKGPLLYNSLLQVISINCSIHKYKKSIKSYYLSDLWTTV